ncbi:MAG: hypothetical protein C0631_12310 [Sedimenticola sp.]|nr:MAG: hypothetical protein C0631_12310 [Sedimenticola sp.]
MTSTYRYKFLLSPSRLHLGFLLVSGIFPLVLVGVMEMPSGPKWLLLAVLVLFGLLQYLAWRNQQKTIVYLEQLNDCDWRLGYADGTVTEGRITENSYLTRYLMIFRLVAKDRQGRKIILFPDSLGEGEFRRLRLRIITGLKTGQNPELDQGV